MKNYFNERVRAYKLCCDGCDYIQNINLFSHSPFEISYAKNHCIISDFAKLTDFYDYTLLLRKEKNIQLFDLSEDLLNKYEVGYFKVEYGLNFHDSYILFSDENIRKWENIIPLTNLEFAVCFSRNTSGEINGIGMRLLQPDLVDHAFKWLFPMGQKCTFGLHTCKNETELILVEGFTDMIAGKESGYNNCVGLGSVTITENHIEELINYKYVFCRDQDSYGMQLRRENKIECLYSPHNFKDPYEAYKFAGKICFHKIQA